MLPNYLTELNRLISYINFGILKFVLPVRYAPPVTEHVPLRSDLLFKNMARESRVQIICTH